MSFIIKIITTQKKAMNFCHNESILDAKEFLKQVEEELSKL